MEVLWDRGEATVREVHGVLRETRDPAYTTVMTTMSRLASKGLLVRDTDGLAHRYRAATSREEYARSTVTNVVDWLVDAFPERAMSYFAEVMGDSTDDRTMAGLREQVDQKRATEQ